MEIERKFLVNKVPFDINAYPARIIEQAYLNTDPVVRVRRDNQDSYLTYKSKGFLAREEYNLPLNEESYTHLLAKADGNVISKTRYNIPLPSGYTAELDYFKGAFSPLKVVEVEFPTEEEAVSFKAPEWFGQEVTYDSDFHNSTMSRMSESSIKKLLAKTL